MNQMEIDDWWQMKDIVICHRMKNDGHHFSSNISQRIITLESPVIY